MSNQDFLPHLFQEKLYHISDKVASSALVLVDKDLNIFLHTNQYPLAETERVFLENILKGVEARILSERQMKFSAIEMTILDYKKNLIDNLKSLQINFVLSFGQALIPFGWMQELKKYEHHLIDEITFIQAHRLKLIAEDGKKKQELWQILKTFWQKK